MSSYLNVQEIHNSLKYLVKEYITECEACEELNPDFIDLIKHNFLAKYVIYNKDKKQIEIGIEAQESEGPYPKIDVYSFSIGKSSAWLEKSFRADNCDLEYYGKLLNRHSISEKPYLY